MKTMHLRCCFNISEKPLHQYAGRSSYSHLSVVPQQTFHSSSPTLLRESMPHIQYTQTHGTHTANCAENHSAKIIPFPCYLPTTAHTTPHPHTRPQVHKTSCIPHQHLLATSIDYSVLSRICSQANSTGHGGASFGNRELNANGQQPPFYRPNTFRHPLHRLRVAGLTGASTGASRLKLKPNLWLSSPGIQTPGAAHKIFLNALSAHCQEQKITAAHHGYSTCA